MPMPQRQVVVIVLLTAVGAVVTFIVGRMLPGRTLLGLGFIQFGAYAFILREPLARLRGALYRRVALNPSERFLEVGGLTVAALALAAGVIILASAFV